MAGKSFYVNSFDGHERYEDFFIQELMPAIDHKYRTIANRKARGISGVSMGGYGALHLGMKHPDVFGSASAHSAALIAKFPNPLPTEGRWGFYAQVLQEPFGSPLNEAYFDANNPLTLAEHPERFANLKLYFDCGDQDRYGFDAGAKELDEILTSKGFPTNSSCGRATTAGAIWTNTCISPWSSTRRSSARPRERRDRRARMRGLRAREAMDKLRSILVLLALFAGSRNRGGLFRRGSARAGLHPHPPPARPTLDGHGPL